MNDIFLQLTRPSQEFKENRIKRFLYKILYSKLKRQNMDFEYAKLVALKIDKYWQKNIRLYTDGQIPIFNITPKKKLQTEKIIWQYWGQGINDRGLLPDIVKLSFASVDLRSNGYKVIRLDDKNLGDYIDLPEFVWSKRGVNGFEHALFADIVRLALLSAYGGVWIDATIYLSSPISENILSQDIFMFQRMNDTKKQDLWESFDSNYFGWNPFHLVNVLSSFIVSKKNHLFIKAMLNLLLNFWKTESKVPHYFIFQILFEALKDSDSYPGISLELNDTDPHRLQLMLASPFLEQQYDSITSLTSIHKLTYPKQLIPGSVYDILLKKYSVSPTDSYLR